MTIDKKIIMESYAMLLSEIFKPSNIKTPLESEDKEELFEELIYFLADCESLSEPEMLKEKLWERENIVSTGIGQGMAIPHLKLKGINKVMGVMGISKDGLEYDALDGEPVNIIMLVVADDAQPEVHLKVLKQIAMLLQNQEFFERIINAGDPDEIYDILLESEEIV